MEDLNLMDALERYMEGKMTPDERVYFEGLRKSNPEIDQLVVEHTFFMQQLSRYDEVRKLKGNLNDIHTDLAEAGEISSPRLRGRAKVAYLFNRYKRTAAIAASIATITALSISLLVPTVGPNKPATNEDLQDLNRKMNDLAKENKIQTAAINQLKTGVTAPGSTVAPIIYKKGGTGFLIDSKGYLVTKAHVIAGAKNIAVQNSAGKDMVVSVAFVDESRDLAILKIKDPAFHAVPLPYSIRKKDAELADQIFTLGYPRNEIVYGEGYLAARTGYNGDTLSCQIAIAANPGNSGGPILNRNGEVIGVLGARQNSAEGVVFATQSKYIHKVLTELQATDTAAKRIRIPTSSAIKGLDRKEQVKRMADFVYMVKVN
jgi:serine protease Do